MKSNYQYRIKGNESFTIREGWLRKILRHIPVNSGPNVFKSSDATEIFGVGSNMVKSIRYWSVSTGLAIEEKSGKRNHCISEIGNLINQYDPYFDDIFSLWLVHYNLSTNEQEATLWYLFFNEFNAKTFTKDGLFRELFSIFCTKSDERPSEKSFMDDCNSVIKTYCSDEKSKNPEETYICPLTELSLINHVEKDRFERTMPTMQKLDRMMVLYSVLRFLESREGTYNLEISLEDALFAPGGPGRVFNLSRYRLFEYFELLRSLGYLRITRTAGLNMIYVKEGINSIDIVRQYYSKRNEVLV